MIGKEHHLYNIREKVDLQKSFWWERLPILRHLVTKRAFSKHHHIDKVIRENKDE